MAGQRDERPKSARGRGTREGAVLSGRDVPGPPRCARSSTGRARALAAQRRGGSLARGRGRAARGGGPGGSRARRAGPHRDRAGRGLRPAPRRARRGRRDRALRASPRCSSSTCARCCASSRRPAYEPSQAAPGAAGPRLQLCRRSSRLHAASAGLASSLRASLLLGRAGRRSRRRLRLGGRAVRRRRPVDRAGRRRRKA